MLATALVIAAGSGAAEHRAVGVLTNPVSQYIGNISYSMYLWHWPIIIFGGLLLADNGFIDDAVIIGAIVLASVYGYHLVEDPIRRSDWLSGTPREPRTEPTLRPRQPRPERDPARADAVDVGQLRRESSSWPSPCSS